MLRNKGNNAMKQALRHIFSNYLF